MTREQITELKGVLERSTIRNESDEAIIRLAFNGLSREADRIEEALRLLREPVEGMRVVGEGFEWRWHGDVRFWLCYRFGSLGAVAVLGSLDALPLFALAVKGGAVVTVPEDVEGDAGA